MRFFLVDDDDTIRAILTDIIEDENLGTVVGEGIDGSEIHLGLLLKKRVDVLIIDLLMPNRDGIETIREIGQQFPGKVVMLSQVETKELIGEAYSLGIDYYITKPVNRLEVLHVLKKIRANILLEKSIQDFQTSLSQLRSLNFSQRGFDPDEKNKATQFQIACKTLLTDLGIISECGHKDLLDILHVMYQQDFDEHSSISSLKTLFEQAAMKRYGCMDDLQKEIKSSEQRVRRAIHQSLTHIASLGLSDYSNPIFEQCASKFFDFTQVRFKMSELRTNPNGCTSHARVNIKKFIQALYMEAMSQLRE